MRRAEWRAPRSRPRGPRWLFGAALALSVLIHLLVFLVMRFSVLVPGEAQLLQRSPRAVPVLPGLRVITFTAVEEVTTPAIGVEELPAPRPTPLEPPSPGAVTPPPTAAETGARDERPRTLVERIRPRTSDPRLWIPILPPAERVLTPDEAVRARVADRLAAWNDSMAAEADAAARALDWTHTDADGNKWGISPGKIHLGALTIPLPFGFGPPPAVGSAMRDRVDGWNAIERQAGDAKARDDFKDRVKAIRQMQDAKRDSTKKKS
jgi:hypothetical protein